MTFTADDRLARASRLLVLLGAVAACALASILLDPVFRSRPEIEQCAQLARALRLTAPAWTPSGRTSRHPQAAHRAVDLRPDPRVPLYHPSAEGLVLPVAPNHGPRSTVKGKR